MNEILQKRIEAESNKYMEEAIEMNGVVGDNLHYKDLKTCFIEAADFALQNQWISVDEALPSLGSLCLVDGKSGLKLSIYMNMFVDAGNITQRIDSVTHWMHIPQLKGGE